MEVIAVASAVVGAVGQYKAGQAQQAMYKSQAVWNNIQAEQDALAYEQEGVNALKKTLKTVATITARGAAGNLNPWAGSTGNLQDNVLNEGFTDFNIATMNASNRRKTGEYQSGIFRAAGKSAYQQGIFGAVATIGGAAATYGSIGSKPSGGGGGGFNPNSSGGQGPIFGY